MSAIEELEDLIEYCKEHILDGTSDTEMVTHTAQDALDLINSLLN